MVEAFENEYKILTNSCSMCEPLDFSEEVYYSFEIFFCAVLQSWGQLEQESRAATTIKPPLMPP